MPEKTKKKAIPRSSRVKATRASIEPHPRAFVAYSNYDWYPKYQGEWGYSKNPVHLDYALLQYELPEKYQVARYYMLSTYPPKNSEGRSPKIYGINVPTKKIDRVLEKHENIQRKLDKSNPNYLRASANTRDEIGRFARHKRVTKGKKSYRS